MYLPCGQRVLLPLCRPDGDAPAHASCAAIRAKAKIHERRNCAMLPVNNHLSAHVAPSGPRAPTTGPFSCSACRALTHTVSQSRRSRERENGEGWTGQSQRPTSMDGSVCEKSGFTKRNGRIKPRVQRKLSERAASASPRRWCWRAIVQRRVTTVSQAALAERWAPATSSGRQFSRGSSARRNWGSAACRASGSGWARPATARRARSAPPRGRVPWAAAPRPPT